MRSHYLLAALIVAGLAMVISLPSPAGEAPSKEQIDKLIEQMGSGTFSEREKATRELTAIGVPALEALRKAAKSDDPEIRRRAGDLLVKIERQAESARILTAKSVHLVYQETPLSEAIAEFQKQSGYTIRLHDPDEKLKDRRITLDTGETAFWHALELFCAKAELTETSMEELMQVPPPQPIGAPGGIAPAAPAAPVPPPAVKPLPPAKEPAKLAPQAPAGKPAPAQVRPAAPPVAPKPAVVRPRRPFVPVMPGLSGEIVLKAGKAKKLPIDDRGAVRVRALRKSDLFGKAAEGEVIVALELSPEPRLQWQSFQSIRIEKAVDDQDQSLKQVVPQVEGGIGVGGVALPLAPGGGLGWRFMAPPGMMGGSLHQRVPVQLKKGAKAAAKSLKELKGVITADLLTETRSLIIADKLDKAAGKVFKGEAGGFIKILEVKSAKEQTTIRLELEQPPADKVVPALPNAMPGLGGVPIGLPRPGVKILPAPAVPAPAPPPPPAPAAPAAPPAGLAAQAPPAPQPPVPQVQIQIGAGGGGGIAFVGGMQFAGPFNGLSVQDAKDKALPIQVQQVQGRVVQQGNGILLRSITYTLVCQHDKDKGQPAKVVFLGRKRATVDIPFTLKDVPLP
ncbi:MAG TPA: HEAT repeat domain-containing protein [Gemmataceae bacterium]|nr:HEAT repeat domain-containing protein [Gemmataceae bacterium]